MFIESLLARCSRERTYVTPRRFCRHLCEVNCLSDGSTAPIKSIAMREGAKGRREGGRERQEGGEGWWAPYGLSCLETHEPGKSSFEFDSGSSSLTHSRLFADCTRRPFRRCEKRSLPSLPFITIRNDDDVEALFSLDCAAKRCSR